MFAPSDAAFSAMSESDIEYLLDHPEVLYELLNYHISNQVVFGDSLVDGLVLEMNNGQNTQITESPGGWLNPGGVLINDAGTMRMTTVQTLKTYMGAELMTPVFKASLPNNANVNNNSAFAPNQSQNLGSMFTFVEGEPMSASPSLSPGGFSPFASSSSDASSAFRSSHRRSQAATALLARSLYTRCIAAVQLSCRSFCHSALSPWWHDGDCKA